MSKFDDDMARGCLPTGEPLESLYGVGWWTEHDEPEPYPYDLYIAELESRIAELDEQVGALQKYADGAMNEIDYLEARIAELEEERRWIPVSERLPEANVRVLFCNGNRFAVGWYDTNDDIYDWSCWDDKWPGVTPTHWMPIPEPPEVQE